MRRVNGIILAVALSIASIDAGLADPTPAAGVPTEDALKAFALQWFAQMQAGKIDRTQYAAAYGAQLTDDAVQAMSRHLNEYGASPLVQRNRKNYYVYADPAHWQIFVGTPSQYQKYQQLRLANNLAQDQLQTAQLNSWGPGLWGFPE